MLPNKNKEGNHRSGYFELTVSWRIDQNNLYIVWSLLKKNKVEHYALFILISNIL